MNIDIKQIRLVEALTRHGNFARAAVELEMTQPGLSRALQSLEQNLGVKLFDRSKREVTPTVFGSILSNSDCTWCRTQPGLNVICISSKEMTPVS